MNRINTNDKRMKSGVRKGDHGFYEVRYKGELVALDTIEFLAKQRFEEELRQRIPGPHWDSHLTDEEKMEKLRKTL